MNLDIFFVLISFHPSPKLLIPFVFLLFLISVTLSLICYCFTTQLLNLYGFYYFFPFFRVICSSFFFQPFGLTLISQDRTPLMIMPHISLFFSLQPFMRILLWLKAESFLCWLSSFSCPTPQDSALWPFSIPNNCSPLLIGTV